jgi:hypothetical protein
MLFFPALPAITDYVARASIVQGYSTDTYQTTALDPLNPAYSILTRHESLFTGVDLMGEVRITNSKGDITDIRLEGRAQHYEPVPADPNQSDDGTVSGAFASRLTLNPRTFLSVNASGTISTINGSHLSDGTVFEFDPTEARRTYWLAQPQVGISYELSKTWRYRQSVGAFVSGTIYEPPTELPNGSYTEHRGLDFVQPFTEADLYKDFTDRAMGDLQALFIYSYDEYLLNLAVNPPVNIGPQKQAFLTVTAGYTYHFTPELVTTTRFGGTIASAPPLDYDQRPVLAPTALQIVQYSREFWQFLASAGYTYGSVNPRLGTGPTAQANALIVGTPYRVGNWRNLAIMVNALAEHSTLIASATQSTVLDLFAGSAEVRYALNPTWGLLAGYDLRYATFSGDVGGSPQPPFLRHMVYLGVSGDWSTDKTIPILTQFAAPVKPM